MDQTSSFHQPKKSVKVNDFFATFYFLWIGGTSSVGWNVIINCIDYFNYYYPGYDVKFVFPLPFYVAQLSVAFAITFISNRWSYNKRVIVTLCIIICIVSFLPFQAQLFQGSQYGFIFIIGLIYVLGFAGNLCYASIGGMTSQVDGKYTTSFLIGVAVSYLVNNLFREATLLIFRPESDGEIASILVNFGFTILLVCVALVLHRTFMNSEFYKFHYLKEPLVLDSENSSKISLIPREEPRRPQRSVKTLLEVFRYVKHYLALVLLLNLEHTLLYPGVMLEKTIPGMSDHTKTVTMICAFSLFFIIGKKMGQYRKYYTGKVVAAVVILRYLFLATFLLQADDTELPVLRTVWFGYVNIAFFALTMGFANVALFILSPEQVEGDNKEVAGFETVFAINIGSITGGFLSLTLVKPTPAT